MKPRNWRKRFGTPLTTDRELCTLSDDALRDQRDAYEEWLRAAGHVRPTDVDFAAARRSRYGFASDQGAGDVEAR